MTKDLVGIAREFDSYISSAGTDLTQLIGVSRVCGALLQRVCARLESIEVSPPEKKSTPTQSAEFVPVEDGLGLHAIRVKSFADVRKDNNLYYIESADHFAIYIADQLYNGNIGTVYADTRNPLKVKECKFADSCMKGEKCDYYHDPRVSHGSRDHRNYIASSFMYTPPQNRREHPLSRKYGSRGYLESDAGEMSDPDKRRFHSQVMHDLLCSLLIKPGE